MYQVSKGIKTLRSNSFVLTCYQDVYIPLPGCEEVTRISLCLYHHSSDSLFFLTFLSSDPSVALPGHVNPAVRHATPPRLGIVSGNTSQTGKPSDL